MVACENDARGQFFKREGGPIHYRAGPAGHRAGGTLRASFCRGAACPRGDCLRGDPVDGEADSDRADITPTPAADTPGRAALLQGDFSALRQSHGLARIRRPGSESGALLLRARPRTCGEGGPGAGRQQVANACLTPRHGPGRRSPHPFRSRAGPSARALRCRSGRTETRQRQSPSRNDGAAVAGLQHLLRWLRNPHGERCPISWSPGGWKRSRVAFFSGESGCSGCFPSSARSVLPSASE